MAVRAQFVEYVIEQLAGLPAVRPNRMFSGVGLYCGDVFFAVIADDTLYFKTGEANIAAYRERGMPRFMPFPDRPVTTLGYHQVPADVLEDGDALVQWARQAVSVALEKKQAGTRKAQASPKADVRVKARAKKKPAARKPVRRARARR